MILKELIGNRASLLARSTFRENVHDPKGLTERLVSCLAHTEFWHSWLRRSALSENQEMPRVAAFRQRNCGHFSAPLRQCYSQKRGERLVPGFPPHRKHNRLIGKHGV